MNLRDLMGYGTQRGTMAANNFGHMLMARMRKWVKHDKDTLRRLYRCSFVTEYDWANDHVKAAIVLDGKHLFTLTDPDDPDQINALAVALQLTEDDLDGQTISGSSFRPRGK